MSYGIILIDYNKGTTDNQIQHLVSSFYKDNETTIDGMLYYETDHKDLIVNIKTMCTGKPTPIPAPKTTLAAFVQE